MRYAARKDVVHAPIVEGLRMHGVVVFSMPEPGDVLCYYHGTWTRLEFKSDKVTRGYKREKTAAQEKRATLAEIPIVHTLSEALDIFGIRLESK